MVKKLDGRNLDHGTLEAMRLRAVDLMLDDGVSAEDIARAYGFGRAIVYRWKKQALLEGRESLVSRKSPGPKRKLSDTQLSQLERLIASNTPDQLQLDFGLWTRKLIQEVIKTHFYVDYTIAQVGNIMHMLGFSVQKPTYQACEADPVKVQEWVQVSLPAIKAEAKRVGATVFYGDEAGVSSNHHSGATWAKVGRRPVVESNSGSRSRVNMISAVSAKGQLHFQVVDGNVNSGVFLEWLKRLVGDIEGKIFLILDGHGIHKTKEVTDYVESTNGQLTLFYLPTYSPQLNADEQVWNHVKNNDIGRRVINSLMSNGHVHVE